MLIVTCNGHEKQGDYVFSGESLRVFSVKCDNGDQVIFRFSLAMSQDTDTSKNTKAALKCCYALQSHVGTVLSHDSSLYSSMHPPEREINPPKMACGCPCGGVIEQRSYT